MLISELTYTDEQLEQDTVRFIKNQVYSPAYVSPLQEFLNSDIDAFRRQFNDAQNHFESIWCEGFHKGNLWRKGKLYPRLNRDAIREFADMNFFSTLHRETAVYGSILEEKANTPKNHSILVAWRGNDTGNLAVTAINGYSINPYHSIYNIARNWCTAIHEKKFRNSIQFRLLQHIHANIFANLYLYLKALESGDKKTIIIIRQFIYQTAAETTEIDDENLDLSEFDYPVTKYVLQSLDPQTASELYNSQGEINFIKLYNYSFESIFQSGFATLYLRDDDHYKLFHLYISEINMLKEQLSKQKIFEKLLYDLVEDQYINQENINPYLLHEEEARRYLTPFDSYLDKYPELNAALQQYRQMKKQAELFHFQTREKIIESRAYQIELNRH